MTRAVRFKVRRAFVDDLDVRIVGLGLWFGFWCVKELRVRAGARGSG